MAAKQKEILPQEGTGYAGESLPEPSSGCPSNSGGGKVLPQMEFTYDEQRKQTQEPKLVQQTFHKGMFLTRTRSNSLTNFPSSSHQLTEVEAVSSITASIIEQEKQETFKAANTHPDWQRLPITRNAKRRRTSPKLTQETIQTTNRFDNLPIDIMDDEDEPKKKKPAKPPPIILYGIENVHKLIELLESDVERHTFSIKIVNKNQLRISCTEVETYRSIIATVRKNGLIGHTFNTKDQRCCRVVVRNLHHTTPHSEIRDAIKSTGNEVSGEIVNARYGPEKTPTSTFFVNLLPSVNNKAVKELKYIYNQSVAIEDPRKKKTILQCQRCQQYGHSKNYCMRPYRCVKCAEPHKTSECSRTDRNTPAQCALCLGPHPANFKGCEVYKEILHRKGTNTNRKPQETKRNLRQPKEKRETTSITGEISQKETSDQRSYAETTKSHNNKTANTGRPPNMLPGKPSTLQNHKITQTTYNNWGKPDNQDKPEKTTTEQSVEHTLETLILKQSEKFDLILQQMSSLISLITSLITKLT